MHKILDVPAEFPLHLTAAAFPDGICEPVDDLRPAMQSLRASFPLQHHSLSRTDTHGARQVPPLPFVFLRGCFPAFRGVRE